MFGVDRKLRVGCCFVCLLLDIAMYESVLSARRHYNGIARFFLQELAGAFVYKRNVAAINEQLNAEQRFDYMMRMATATTSFGCRRGLHSYVARICCLRRAMVCL